MNPAINLTHKTKEVRYRVAWWARRGSPYYPGRIHRDYCTREGAKHGAAAINANFPQCGAVWGRL